MAETAATTVTTETPATSAPTVTVEAAGNGKRTQRIDVILALMMFVCIAGIVACNYIVAAYDPQGGTYQMLSDTRAFFAQTTRDILIGFLTLAYPKR